MGEEARHYGQQAFEFIEDLNRLSTTDEVMDTMACAFDRFGFKTLAIGRIPKPGQRFEDVVLAKRWPAGWFEIYVEKQYVDDDPLIDAMRCAATPFEWSEALYDAQPTPRTAEILQCRRDFGIERGFVVPNPGVHDSDYFVNMSGHRPDLTARTKPAISLMALYGLCRVSSLRVGPPRDRPRLTPRESEVLTWAASGKTAWEIGEILTIAKRTVDEHTHRAFRKLGAVNRTQAVAIALHDRLIEL